MDKRIENKDRVSKETIQVYQQINIYDVIKETLLCKGVEICIDDRLVAKKYLEDSALYLYELKANSTNRLHVGLTIDRLCQRNGLCSDKGDKWVIVPRDIYCKVKEINDSYKTRCSKEDTSREEQIKQAAKNAATVVTDVSEIGSKYCEIIPEYQSYFEEGAKWADEHPFARKK